MTTPMQLYIDTISRRVKTNHCRKWHNSLHYHSHWITWQTHGLATHNQHNFKTSERNISEKNQMEYFSRVHLRHIKININYNSQNINKVNISASTCIRIHKCFIHKSKLGKHFLYRHLWLENTCTAILAVAAVFYGTYMIAYNFTQLTNSNRTST